MIIFKNKQKTNNMLDNNNNISNITADKNLNNISKSERNLYSNIIYYPSSKEWYNSVYSFNKSYIKSLPSYDLILNKLITSFSNMVQDKIKVTFKRRRSNWSRYSANKVYNSRAELKHTNNSITITSYLFNKKKLSIEKWMSDILSLVTVKRPSKTRAFSGNLLNKLSYLLRKKFFSFQKYEMSFFKPMDNLSQNDALDTLRLNTTNMRNTKKVLTSLNTLLNVRDLVTFDKFKFSNPFFNSKNLGLSSLIEKLYNKKIYMNFTNQKAIRLNSDIIARAIALKLRDRKKKAVSVLRKAIVQMVKIPTLHTFITFDDTIEKMNKNNIVKTIKQQVVSGVRFEASGRLTRRLTAMRAVFKYAYAGSLKYIRSAFNGKPSTMLRGFAKSNAQYTLINSKTRNGTFGLKTWVSSHVFYGGFFINLLCILGNIMGVINHILNIKIFSQPHSFICLPFKSEVLDRLSIERLEKR